MGELGRIRGIFKEISEAEINKWKNYWRNFERISSENFDKFQQETLEYFLEKLYEKFLKEHLYNFFVAILRNS